MEENNGYTMTCPKCGQEMNSNARYCMKCGYINPNHEANKGMKKYMKNVETSYQVGSGKLINNDSNKTGLSIATNTGNRKIAFFVTYGLYILLVGIALYITITNGVNDLNSLISSYFPIMLLCISLAFLYIYSLELVFMKCNKPWWSGLIPIYNLIVLGDIVFHKKYIGLLVLIPVVGLIFLLVMIYKLGVKFKYNGLLTVLFSFIYLPLMAYGEHIYEGKIYVDGSEKSLEKDYKLKKIFLGTMLFCLVIGIILYSIGIFGGVKKTKQLFGNSYYIMASNKMLRKVKNGVENGQIVCKNGTYNEHEGVYYVYYNDLGDAMYLPLYLSRDPIEAYVKIDNNINSIKTEYYASMTDGKYGFGETLDKDISVSTVVEYTNLNFNKSNIICEIFY